MQNFSIQLEAYLNEIEGMTHAVLYKYINCTVDKLLALEPVMNYITKYSIIKITTIIVIVIIIIIIIITL